MSALFAAFLGMDSAAQKTLRYSAPLHDVGKIAIPDRILLKPGKLTAQEFAVIQTHTTLGHEMLKNSHSRYLREGAVIALTHHEHWNGTGYPAGLSGDAIPLSGRIVAILDVFDALISERPYKRAWTDEKALELIVSERSRHFDPQLVDVFVEHFEQFRTR